MKNGANPCHYWRKSLQEWVLAGAILQVLRALLGEGQELRPRGRNPERFRDMEGLKDPGC